MVHLTRNHLLTAGGGTHSWSSPTGASPPGCSWTPTPELSTVPAQNSASHTLNSEFSDPKMSAEQQGKVPVVLVPATVMSEAGRASPRSPWHAPQARRGL